MPASLKNQFISDLYTSLLHLSGAQLGPYGPLNRVFDGAGNSTGLALSGDRVVVNNYIYPKGFDPQSNPPTGWLDAFFPVGSLQLTFDENDPGTRIAGTTWDLVSQGKFLVGVGTFKDKNGDTYKFCPGEPPEAIDSGNLAGEYRHTLDVNEIPSHQHTTNIGGTTVKIPSNVGSGDVSQFTLAGGENSTVTFAEQQRRRNILADKIHWNLGNDYGYIHSGLGVKRRNTETYRVVDNFFRSTKEVFNYKGGRWQEDINKPGEFLGPVKKGFDLNFLLGSAANYSVQERTNYQNSENWQFKEMIGIWNGETRFIASNPAGDRNVTSNSVQAVLKNINWYEFCKTLGCKDVDGVFVAGEDNQAPFVDGNASILDNQWDAMNNKNSTVVGLGNPHNNIPPSYGVYVWKRIA